jgi:hypothetical protein
MHHHDDAGLGQVLDEAGAPLAEPELVRRCFGLSTTRGSVSTAITSRID